MTREEAMRAALSRVCDGSDATDLDVITAGADAELSRVVEWLRYQADGPGRDPVAAAFARMAADVLEARAHWNEGA